MLEHEAPEMTTLLWQNANRAVREIDSFTGLLNGLQKMMEDLSATQDPEALGVLAKINAGLGQVASVLSELPRVELTD